MLLKLILLLDKLLVQGVLESDAESAVSALVQLARLLLKLLQLKKVLFLLAALILQLFLQDARLVFTLALVVIQLLLAGFHDLFDLNLILLPKFLLEIV